MKYVPDTQVEQSSAWAFVVYPCLELSTSKGLVVGDGGEMIAGRVCASQ